MNKPKAPAADTSKAPAGETSTAETSPGKTGPGKTSPAKTSPAKTSPAAKTPVGRQARPALPQAPRGAAAVAVAAERPEPPRPVLLAVRAMYAGAVVTGIGLVITVIGLLVGGEHALRISHPHASVARLHATENFLITIAVVSGLVEIAAWLLMARANRGGLKWARVIASGLFVLSTFNFVSHLSGPVAIGNIIYSVVMWLIGLAAVYFLWRKESSTYFA